MAFVGVEFIDEDNESGDRSIGVVSKSWLTPRKKEVFWPPCKQQIQFNKLLRNHHPADDTWKLYGVSRLIIIVIDDFEKATKKIKKAEDTSDLQSDAEICKKRKYKRPQRLSYGSSDDEGLSTRFQRPPLIKVAEAVKANSLNIFEKDIEDAIKVWLKHAPQRLKFSRRSL
ncbi:hypothetical protein MML48_4g00018284 [Holotrichia oblita]|uniref:Uncharacterized protein n=1 Tax=Holotrichia oblita TaxID=644536 RepID=A0ACB9T833_HOLOL|nr:hypothetical protein MML48_4g00018284 [Holotrichia oblita]